MRIAIVGTGGVGGYFGARLAAAGESVAFLARGQHLDAIRRDGLKVESALGNVHIHPAEATDDAQAIGPVDVAIVAVKLYDDAAAAEECMTLLGPRTAVVSFQNGVTAADTLAAAVGRERVFGGTAQILAVIARPGVIAHTGTMARLQVGEFAGGSSPRVKALADALRHAGVDVEESSDIAAAIWSKFAFLAPFSGMTALTRATIGPIRANEDARALFRRAVEEVAAVACARGVNLATDAPDKIMAFVNGLPAEMGSSMLHDLRAGKRLELPWLSGAVSRLGREGGVVTPTHDFIVAALGLYAAGGVNREASPPR